jgi:hypothetical protein
MHRRPIHDQADADARPDGDIRDRLLAGAGVVRILGERWGVHVRVEEHGDGAVR